jgi:deoxyribose-phosphate aldolase
MTNLNEYIDHTLLKPEATKEQVEKLCEEAIEHSFKSVCINPYYIPVAKKILFGKTPLVCTVIGFPLGMNTTETKVYETAKAIDDGADEIDMVINIGAMVDGDYETVKADIAAIHEVTNDKNKLLKVIFETSKLTNEQIQKACEICVEVGVEFVKTSTGFGGGGATLEHIKLMRETVGADMGVKASGGVRDKETAMRMIEAGATRIGTSSGIQIVS